MSIAHSKYQGSNSDIEQIADSLRKAVFPQGNPLRGRALLDEIIERTGGSVEVVEDPGLQEAEGGSLIIRAIKDYTIFLSPYTTPLRDNFTIAHELGHLFLHYILQDSKPSAPACFTRYGSGPIEWQANRFAAGLLMPAEEFKKQYNVNRSDIYLVSGYFEVSRAAVEARADSLDLCEADTQESTAGCI